MKRKAFSAIILSLTVLSTSIATLAQEDNQFLFRGYAWATSKAEIQKGETQPPTENSKDYLLYNVSLFNLSFECAYVFENDRLVMGKYILKSKFPDLNDYIRVYMKLLKQLEEKYGKPNENRSVWRNSRLEFERERWGEAVSVGDVYYYANWLINKTEVNINLSGLNGNIYLQLQYRDLNPVIKNMRSEMDMI